jgi:hypothetical protein
MRRPDALDERAKQLRSTLQAAYANVVTSPLPSDMADLLRAIEGEPEKPRRSGLFRRRKHSA